jgi:transposase
MEIRRRRFRSKEERRQIVEETLKPGASVSLVARAHDINANQVFHWRRQYREGWFDKLDSKASSSLVPVKISNTPDKTRAAATGRSARTLTTTAGSIEIDFGHARVRIVGTADPDCVRAAIEGLIR